MSEGFPCGSTGKESACNAGDLSLIPGLGRSPGEGKSYPLQYSGLENYTKLIVYTLFQQNKRRLYTWTSPDGQLQNQTDYILCSQKWSSSIQSAKTRPGADCGSDHELLIAKFRLILKKVGKTTRPLIIREMLIKTTVSHHSSHFNNDSQKIPDNKNCWWECGETGTLVHCWWEWKMAQLQWKTV